MQVKRTLLFWSLGDKTRIKALSLLLTLKNKLDKTQSIHNATQNKIAMIAGVSPSTVKRYMIIWERLGLVEWRGRRGDVFVINRVASKTKHRNIDISRIKFDNFKSVYEQFRSFLFIIILSCKAFVKRMIQIANTSCNVKEVKSALKSCNRYAKRNSNNQLEYDEQGISYSTIGQKLGFCKRMAEKVVKKAINKKWCTKHTHYEWTYMPGVNGMYVDGYTFTTKNYAFSVKANTYCISKNLCLALIGGKK